MNCSARWKMLRKKHFTFFGKSILSLFAATMRICSRNSHSARDVHRWAYDCQVILISFACEFGGRNEFAWTKCVRFIAVGVLACEGDGQMRFRAHPNQFKCMQKWRRNDLGSDLSSHSNYYYANRAFIMLAATCVRIAQRTWSYTAADVALTLA